MAERGGFEPPVEFDPYDGLANRSFRPLRHLSATVQNVFYTILRFRVKSRRNLKKNKKWREFPRLILCAHSACMPVGERVLPALFT